ncbi:hypothetical protein FAGAP_12629 [Fusarium agapanthi]|uniref:CorA-like transporter domain-containing protein n=1 Tax=Fusarium agapanthi TaxID=1803897 RepID=A0A9P5AX59_9HYPO|nr:hypothetical protein FAGAP_12629 [Fusarium agapanthi]
MSADKVWSPYCTQDDVRTTQIAEIITSGARTLLSALRVFPQIHRHMTAFGGKRFPRDEGFAGFNLEARVSSAGILSSFECSYLLKYIEKRDGARPGSNPWSIRHTLIYQKVSVEENKLTHILIRLPLAVKKFLGSSVLKISRERSQFIEDWTNLHITCFSSVDHNLHQFINYLDEEIDKLFKRVILAGVEPDKLNEFDALSSTTNDFKSLQYLSDQLRRVINIIQLNILTMKCFQKKIRDLETVTPQTSSQADSLARLLKQLCDVQSEHEFNLPNASTILERAKAISDQLRDTVSMRNGEFNRTSTAMTSRNTSAIVHLSDKSSREARVVKTLTVLAMVFVPAAFTADFVQMGFITIKHDSPMKWSADPDLKIYAILAIPLISITMLIYILVEFIQTAREKGEKANEQFIV